MSNLEVTQAPIEVLEKMLEYTIPGARYNSAARDPPPRCHLGTRTRILEDTNARVLDKDTRIVWLYGPAGSGKSAVIQSLAETLSSSSQVDIATTFLSRDVKRNDPDRIFVSLAYDFAVTNSTYRNHIEKEMASDPDFLPLSMNKQFERLFFFWMDLTNVGARQDKNELLKSSADLRALTLNSPLWVISTREEGYLKTIFETVEETVSGFWKQEVPVGTPDILRDVEVYLRAELGKVWKVECPSAPWPADEDLAQLPDLFFFLASSLVAHITEANPVARLAECLSDPRKAGLDSLGGLYTQNMSAIFNDVLSVAESIFFFSRRSLPVA